MRDFLKTCYEFTTIVTEFNRNYVIKMQKGIEGRMMPEQAFYWIDQLEQFMEEFTHFLRDVEEWAHSVDETAAKRMPDFYRHVQPAPAQIFERVSSFRPKNLVAQPK